jgi:hypothetical protein
MRSFIAVALAGAVSAVPLSSNDFQFMRFVVEHSKSYKTTEEYNMRQANWEKSHAEIIRLNQQNDTATYGHNFTSDYTREEYLGMLGLRNMPKPQRSNGKVFKSETMPTATTVNWCSANGNTATATCNAVKD